MSWRLAALTVSALAAAPALAQDAASARALYQAKRWSELEKAARIWISNDPHDAEARQALGIALLRLGRPEEAVEPLRRAVAISDEPHGRFWLGCALSDAGEFTDAESELRRAAAGLPRDAHVQSSLASARAGQGRYREALEVQRRAAALAPDEPAVGEALEHWKAAARWDFPAEALRRHGRARWLYDRQRYREAAEEYEAALRLAPDFADCHYHLGAAAEHLGDKGRAEREYRAAIAGYGPEEKMVRGSAEYGLGQLLAGRPETAAEGVALMRRSMASEAHGRKPPMVFALAQALATAGDLSGARDAYLEFLAAKPDVGHPEFPIEVATERARKMLIAYGCRPEAGDPPRFSQARCVPIGATARFVSGVDHRNASRFEQAAADFKAALSIDGRYPACRVELGRALAELERWAEAEPVLREALRAPPAELGSWRAAAQSDLALTLVKLGTGGAEAVLLVTQARAEFPKDVATQAWHEVLLGRAFEQAGNRACAIEKLESVIRADGAPEALRARARELLQGLPPSKQGRPVRPCFEYEAYRPTTFEDFERAERQQHGASLGNDRFLLHPLEKVRIRFRSKGERRAVASDRRWFLDKLASEKVLPRDYVALYQEEILVSTEGRDRWLPVQGPLVGDFDHEVKPGREVDLYLVWAGVMRDDLVLLVTEFRSVAP